MLKGDHRIEVSIIIPSLEGLQLLKKNLLPTIGLLDEELSNNYEIIITDDGSTDGTIEWIGSLGLSQVRGIAHPPPRGFGSNCNFAVDQSKGRYLFFLNNDVQLIGPFFQNLLQIVSQDDVFAVVPNIYRPEEKIVESLTTGYFDGNELMLQFKNKHNFNEDMTHPVYWACGAAMLCSRELFMNLGGFASEFEPAYSEDVDLSLRAWRSGYTVWYAGGSKVKHWANSTTRKRWRRRKLRYLQTRNHIILNLKHIPKDRQVHYVVGKIRQWVRKPKLYLIVALIRGVWIYVKSSNEHTFTLSLEDVNHKINSLRNDGLDATK